MSNRSVGKDGWCQWLDTRMRDEVKEALAVRTCWGTNAIVESILERDRVQIARVLGMRSRKPRSLQVREIKNDIFSTLLDAWAQLLLYSLLWNEPGPSRHIGIVQCLVYGVKESKDCGELGPEARGIIGTNHSAPIVVSWHGWRNGHGRVSVFDVSIAWLRGALHVNQNLFV